MRLVVSPAHRERSAVSNRHPHRSAGCGRGTIFASTVGGCLIRCLWTPDLFNPAEMTYVRSVIANRRLISLMFIDVLSVKNKGSFVGHSFCFCRTLMRVWRAPALISIFDWSRAQDISLIASSYASSTRLAGGRAEPFTGVLRTGNEVLTTGTFTQAPSCGWLHSMTFFGRQSHTNFTVL